MAAVAGIQGGIASMAWIVWITEITPVPMRAFSDAGALPANHIGRESVGEAALERGKPEPAGFDPALEVLTSFRRGFRVAEHVGLDALRFEPGIRQLEVAEKRAAMPDLLHVQVDCLAGGT